MKEYVYITEYTNLPTDVLLQEAKDLREGIDNPELTKRHYLAAGAFSTLGPGSTLAAAAGFVDYLVHMKDKATGATESLEEMKNYSGKLRGLIDNWRNPLEYLNDPNNRSFANNMSWVLGTFTVVSAIAMPFFLRGQRQRRAEESVIKLSHVERVLEERGFLRDPITERYLPAAEIAQGSNKYRVNTTLPIETNEVNSINAPTYSVKAEAASGEGHMQPQAANMTGAASDASNPENRAALSVTDGVEAGRPAATSATVSKEKSGHQMEQKLMQELKGVSLPQFRQRIAAELQSKPADSLRSA